MGLTIHYELRLPGATTDADALNLLGRLRGHALTLGVSEVLPIREFNGHALSLHQVVWEPTPDKRLLHILADTAREDRDGTADTVDDSDRLAAAAFFMYPGEGSEAAAFGFVRPRLSAGTGDVPADRDHWIWHAFCKTQYASAVSDEHFVFCHLAVVKMLEEAQRLGFDVTVHDEGRYWDTRSTDRLVAEVRHSNRIIARLAGALHDADLQTEAPIFKSPDFERLETEPLDRDEGADR